MTFVVDDLVRIKNISWQWNGKVGRVCGQVKTLGLEKELVLIDLAPYPSDEDRRPEKEPNVVYVIEGKYLEKKL